MGKNKDYPIATDLTNAKLVGVDLNELTKLFDINDVITAAADGAVAQAGITATDINNWNTAYSWGDWSTQGFATQTWVQSQNVSIFNNDAGYLVAADISDVVYKSIDQTLIGVKTFDIGGKSAININPSSGYAMIGLKGSLDSGSGWQLSSGFSAADNLSLLRDGINEALQINASNYNITSHGNLIVENSSPSNNIELNSINFNNSSGRGAYIIGYRGGDTLYNGLNIYTDNAGYRKSIEILPDGTTNIYNNINTTGIYQLNGIEVFLQELKSGSAGTAGYVLTSNGASVAPTWQATSSIATGAEYTPIFTNLTNISSIQQAVGKYHKIGNVIFVNISIYAIISAAALTSFDVSLPTVDIPKYNAEQNGSVIVAEIADSNWTFGASYVNTNTTAHVSYIATSNGVGGSTMNVSFSYVIN